jgi:hypothetical protein
MDPQFTGALSDRQARGDWRLKVVPVTYLFKSHAVGFGFIANVGLRGLEEQFLALGVLPSHDGGTC